MHQNAKNQNFGNGESIYDLSIIIMVNLTMPLWSGGQGVLWIPKGSEFESAPHQIFTARGHRSFHILSLSLENGLPFFLIMVNFTKKKIKKIKNKINL